jgi:hypothetical protein
MSTLRSKISRASLSMLFLAAALPACGGADDFDMESIDADTGDEVGELGQLEQGLCANGDGVNSAMAALAVATAKELRRWQPSKDFTIDSSYRLALSTTGKAQCADGKCWNTQAILDLQRATHNTVKFGSVIFNADNFRSRLNSEYNEQKICESRAGAPGSNCPAEDHKLTYKSAKAGACDTIFTFDATTPTGSLLKTPSLLKNKLIYVGYPENEYLAFSSTGTTVSIDPTIGLNDTGTTAAGSCTATCTKVSSASIVGQCCSCNGASKKFVKSAWSTTTFLCQ